MPKPAQFDNWPTEGKIPYGPYMAVVERIVDGDTLYVFIDPGLNVYPYHSIRLADVDAPELFTSDIIEREQGRKARAYLESLLPVGTMVILDTDRDRTTFGRYIGWLTRVSDGLDVNADLTVWLTDQGFLMKKRADEQRYVSGLSAQSRTARQVAAKTKDISGPGRKRQGGARSRYDAQTGKIEE